MVILLAAPTMGKAVGAAAFKLHSDWCFIVANEIKYLTVFVFSPHQAAVTPFFWMKEQWNTRQRKSSRKCAARALLAHLISFSGRESNYIYTGREHFIKTCKSIFLWWRAADFLRAPKPLPLSRPNMRDLGWQKSSSPCTAPKYTNAKYYIFSWMKTSRRRRWMILLASIYEITARPIMM